MLDSAWCLVIQFSLIKKKLHTCEEGRAHLRISFRHLLMNFEALEKPEVWKNEKKLLEMSSFYTCVAKTTIIWGTLPKIRSETIFFCHFGSFFTLYHPCPLTIQKTKILKKWNNHLDMSSFETCATKSTIKWSMLTQIWNVTDIIFCHLRPFFALLPHCWPRKFKFGKNVQNNWRNYPFTNMHNKSRSYNARFLRYNVQRSKFFVILGHFLTLWPN